eukprot:gene23012-30203_t
MDATTEKKSAGASSISGQIFSVVLKVVLILFRLAVLGFACWTAYTIRTSAINEYGTLIHEFDPWFNYRATEYLHKHGRVLPLSAVKFFTWFDHMFWYPLGRPVGTTIYPGTQFTPVTILTPLIPHNTPDPPYPHPVLPLSAVKFFTWFDHMSWYPLGRPVGTTIYPGMQFTSVTILHIFKFIGYKMSLNDICCYVPAWFGVSASLFTGLLAYECSGSSSAAAASTLIMAVIPAHIMRSVGGGYDNESIAVTAMCLTFYLWVRCLRTDKSWPIAIAAGIAYFYMVAAWGGYVFVINMIAAHAGALLLMGRFNQKLYRCYTLFYALGTLLAIQIPVVGFTPLKSLEQIVPLVLFFAFQVLQVLELSVVRKEWGAMKKNTIRFLALLLTSALAAGAVYFLLPTNILGPVSLRVRSLFIQHTRTGNPLVDSVAEHQATSPDAYWQFLHYACYLAPVGVLLTLIFGRKGDAKYFLILYAAIAFYFANKMNRLVILMGPVASALSAYFANMMNRLVILVGPVASALSGITLGLVFDWCVDSFVQGGTIFIPDAKPKSSPAATDATTSKDAPPSPSPAPSPSAPKKGKASAQKQAKPNGAVGKLKAVQAGAKKLTTYRVYKFASTALAVFLISQVHGPAGDFWGWSQNFAKEMSSPSIVFNAQTSDGRIVTVTDYLDSYKFLRSKTPKDARILAWWDYGYQITGIGRRTSLADGNTWNQAHIALIGKMLTSSEQKAHRMIRHMADYVLVWAGGDGDDLGKSPHLARIATSNFPKHCGSDRSCQNFGFYGGIEQPTPMMAKSLLYKMTSNKQIPGVTLNRSLWEEVRIYKVKDVDMESRAWLADPANKLCDRPGSWYCPGQYPPAIWPNLPAHFLKGHRLSPNATDEETAAAMAATKNKE